MVCSSAPGQERQRKLEYLVKWLGCRDEHSTIELARSLANAADEQLTNTCAALLAEAAT